MMWNYLFFKYDVGINFTRHIKVKLDKVDISHRSSIHGIDSI